MAQLYNMDCDDSMEIGHLEAERVDEESGHSGGEC